MVRRHPSEVRKTSHLAMERNAWGTHDRLGGFLPHNDIVVRCPKCSNLMDHNYLAEKECPNCHWRFKPSDARDMYVEAISAKVNAGGWNREVLDNLQGKQESNVVRPDLRSGGMDDVARNVAAWATRAQEGMARRRRAEKKLVEHLRKNSANGALLDYLVPGRR